MAIGDVHGNLAALTDLLGKVRSEVAKGDHVVFLGDYVDRGPDSKGVIDAILEFRAATPATVVCLLGNHEDWLLEAKRDFRRHSWLLSMEAWPTIESYSADAANRLSEAAREAGNLVYTDGVELPYDVFFDAMPHEHHTFLESLALSHATGDCIAAHAGIDTRGIPLKLQTRWPLIWGLKDGGFPEKYNGTLPVVYGHRNNAVLNADGWPEPNVIGRTVGIDSSRHRVLTACRFPDGQVFQSARHDY